MQKLDDNDFDTDLDDDEPDQADDDTLLRLSFEKKIAAHRSNRLNVTFGQINLPFLSNAKNDTLIPLQRKAPCDPARRIRIYENSCRKLDTTIDWQLRALLSYEKITVLNRSFSFNDIYAFATAIEVNLRSLTLSSVGLSSRSMKILCQGLKKCVHLNLLDLSNNQIGKQGFEILVDTIHHLSSLMYLSLADCGIRDSYGRQIGDLCRHKRIQEINFSGNEFEETNCILIGCALTENVSLIYLNLSWNFIRSYASIALFRGFEVNKTLTEFDISWSNLGYDGSVALRRVLIVNKVLQRLNISNCNIDWICSKLISEGLARNSTLNVLNLSFNPLTTHGVHRIVQALNTKTNAISILDLSYDFEIPVHDIIGREQATKADARRKIIEHIDERNWRSIDYFRILDKKNKLQAQNEPIPHNIWKYNMEYEIDTIGNLQQHLIDRLVQPFTYKKLSSVIKQQRLRDRWRKVRLEQKEKDLEKRNQNILQTVNQHFPDIDIISKRERHKQAIEQLAKPRTFSPNRRN